MIAAVLQRAGNEVHIIDAVAEQLNIHRLEKRVASLKPDVIGITANISFAKKAFLTGKYMRVKNSGSKIIFGGPWPSIDYEYLLKGKAADFVVIGEGENTIVELVDAIQNRRDMKDIKGIAYIDKGSVIKTEKRPFIEKLDDLPFPAWNLFPPPKKYFNHTLGKRFYPIATSRGCPMGCIYCSKMVHGYKLRTRSIENVMAEIRYLKETFNVDELIFTDDNFNYNVERAERIIDEIIKLGFKLKLNFSHGLRADKITPRLAVKMKRAGAGEVALGIESGNQEVVYKIGKNLDLNAVRRAARILKRLGIITGGFFMIGLPFDTIQTIIETKRFALELDLDGTNFFKVLPFPGTRLFEIIKKRGKFLRDVHDASNFYNYMTPVFEFDQLPNEIVDLAIKEMTRSFYMRPSKILSLLGKIKIKNYKWIINAGFIVISSLFKKQKKSVISKKLCKK